MNPNEIEECFLEYMQDLPRFVPDGIFEVDLSLLQELGVLSYEEETEDEEEGLSYSFYVIESAEKLTLFNSKFVVWIVPKMIEQDPYTYTLIALNETEKPHLEMVFVTKGAYNHSGLILRILERFLEEIEENEQEIVKIKNGNATELE